MTDTDNSVKGTILVVDDDAPTRRALRVTLSEMNFNVIEAARGEEALSLVRITWFDAVLLDVEMPGMGGVETCRRIRQAIARLPILMLTVMDSEDDKVLALDAGADDYITKPFQLRELTARLRSAVRRRNAQDGNNDAPIRSGDLELDPVKYRVIKAGRRIHLTPKEFNVLRYLMSHANRPVSHQMLARAVWRRDYYGDFEYIRVVIAQLRRKLEPNPESPQYIVTDRSSGYRLQIPSQDAVGETDVIPGPSPYALHAVRSDIPAMVP